MPAKSYWYYGIIMLSSATRRLSEVPLHISSRICKRRSVAAGHRRAEVVGSRMPNPQRIWPIGRTSDELDARNSRQGVRNRGEIVLR
jgi:hypothetical protein